MASSSAFNTQGATPGTGLKLSAIPNGSPQGAALSSLANTSTPQKATYAPPTATDTAYGATQGAQTGYTSATTPGAGIGTNPGLLPTAPSQPVVSHTATDAAGNTVTQKYATPDLTNGANQGTTGTSGTTTNGSTTTATPPAYDTTTGLLTDYGKSLQTPQTPYGAAVSNVGTTANQGAQNITNASQPTSAVENAIANINALQSNETNSIASNASTPQEINVGTGRQQILQNQYGSLLNAGQTQLQNAIAEQGVGLTGATSAAGLTTGAATTQAAETAPQAYGLTTQPYNPTTDTYGGGSTGGAINRAVTASNIGSAQDFQTKIQNTQAEASAADANFSILNSYAQGFAGNSPIVNGITQKYGTTAEGNNAVAGFQAQLQAVRQAWTNIVGGDAAAAIPDNITPDQLSQVQQTLKNTAQNNVAGYQKQLGSLSGSSATGGSSSTFGGAAWQ